MAIRYGIRVAMVANTGMVAPRGADVDVVVVGAGADAADDWIVENATGEDIVVATDIPLAARCLAKGALVLRPDGRRFTEDEIGSALAMRDLLKQLRESGERTRGPAPFQERDRSAFLQALDAAVQQRRRGR